MRTGTMNISGNKLAREIDVKMTKIKYENPSFDYKIIPMNKDNYTIVMRGSDQLIVDVDKWLHNIKSNCYNLESYAYSRGDYDQVKRAAMESFNSEYARRFKRPIFGTKIVNVWATYENHEKFNDLIG